jgi:hypothetical protein
VTRCSAESRHYRIGHFEICVPETWARISPSRT